LFTTIYKTSDFIHFNHLFNAIVMSYLKDSLFIYIPENIQIKEPIELSFIQNNQLEKTVNRQVLIYVGANSSVEITDQYSSIENEQRAVANIQIQIIA